jgi:hypothetical protein
LQDVIHDVKKSAVQAGATARATLSLPADTALNDSAGPHPQIRVPLLAASLWFQTDLGLTKSAFEVRLNMALCRNKKKMNHGDTENTEKKNPRTQFFSVQVHRNSSAEFSPSSL